MMTEMSNGLKHYQEPTAVTLSANANASNGNAKSTQQYTRLVHDQRVKSVKESPSENFSQLNVFFLGGGKFNETFKHMMTFDVGS